MLDEKPKIEYKLSLLGDTSVGKTCLFKKITSGTFMEKNISTIGMDKKTLNFDIDVEEGGKTIKKCIDISLVDTAGQERFRTITKSYFKCSDGIILMYDITNKDSFIHVENWMKSIMEVIGDPKTSPFLVLLLGNKVDLVENQEKSRDVTIEEGKQKCQEQGLIWGGECSAKDFSDEQFKELFTDFVQKIYQKVGERTQGQVAKLMGNAKKKKKKKICPFF